MPMNPNDYPDNWQEIATAVKEAADWQCQDCGKQCRRPGEPFDTQRHTLTTSHNDHDTQNNESDNLTARCAPCHLRYDAIYHAKNAAITRRKRMIESGQLSLLPESTQ